MRGRSGRATTPGDPGVRYLLGELSEAQREPFERRLLEDADAFEETEAIEDDLIDDYLAGLLTGSERAHFEDRYAASPERRSRLAFARAFRDRVEAASAPVASSGMRPPPGRRWLALAAMVALAAIGAFLAADSVRARREVAGLEAERSKLERKAAEIGAANVELDAELRRVRESERRLAEQLAAAARPEEGIGIVSFTLSAVLVRDSGGPQALSLPKGATAVRLLCPVESAPPSARASLETPEGKTVWTGLASVATAGSKTFAVVVPAGSLVPGDYILGITSVSGERLADFAFRIR